MSSQFKKLERSLYQAELAGNIYRIDKVNGKWTLLKAPNKYEGVFKPEVAAELVRREGVSIWLTVSIEESKTKCELEAYKDALKAIS